MGDNTMDMNERARVWFITIGAEKFKKENSEGMENWFEKFCKKTGSFGVMQVEQGKSRGNSGLPGAMPEHDGVHLHAMISFKSARTRGGVYKALKPWAKKKFWLVKPDNTEGTIKYCSKEDTRIRETIWVNKELQPMPNGVKRGHTEMVDKIFAGGDLVELANRDKASLLVYSRAHRGLAAAALMRLERTIPAVREVKVSALIGGSGAGKTWAASKIAEPWEIFKVNDDEKVWFDGISASHKVLIIDEMYGRIPYGDLLKILDGYKYMVPTKGGHTYGQWEHVVITSNNDPSTWYPTHVTQWSGGAAGVQQSALERRLGLYEPEGAPPNDQYNTYYASGQYRLGNVVWTPPLPDLFVDGLPGRAIELGDSESESEEDLEPARKVARNEDQQMAEGPRTVLVNEIIDLAADEDEEVLAPATPGVMATWAAELQDGQGQDDGDSLPWYATL